MSVFGPRLDRPSAVGDEGRPRATSLTIASLATVGLFVASGWVLGSPTLIAGIGTLVGLVAAGMGLQRRAGFVDRFVGNLFLLGAGSLLIYLLLAVATLTAGGLVVVGFAVAMLALSMTWANVADEARLGEALSAAVVSYIAFLGWLAGIAVAVLLGIVLWTILTARTLAGEPILALTVLALSTAGAALSVQLALGKLPFLQLTPRSRRERTAARLNAAYDRAAWVMKAAGLAAIVVLLVGVALMGTPALGGPILDALGPVVGSPLVLGLPVAVAVVALLSSGLSMAVRSIAGRAEASTEQLLPAAAAGLAFLLLLTFAIPTLPGLLVYGGADVAVLLAFGPVLFFVALALPIAAVRGGVLPDRAGGPALAAGSLVLATAGAGTAGLPTLLVVATAACSLLVWDVSTFGLGLTAELGHRPETRRLELFHGVLAVGVGGAAVLVLSGVDLLRRVSGLDAPHQLAAAIAVTAVLVAVLVLRR